MAVTDNLNFGSPEKPVGYWQLASACRGIAEACRELNTPVTGGNVSLYNETLDSNGQPTPIYPTPVVGMVGLIPDLTKICGQGWRNEGDIIYLLGLPPSTPATLGASEYLASIHGIIAGKPPQVDFDLERRVQATCREGIRQGWIRSAHDCAEGGLAVALAESCIAAELGAEIHLGENISNSRLDEILFGEGGARIIVSVNPQNLKEWEKFAQNQLGEHCCKIGIVGKSEENLRVFTVSEIPPINVSITDMGERWHNAIERRLAL